MIRKDNVLRMVFVSCFAWIPGLVAHESLLRLAWRQSMGGDWKAVAFWSALALVILAPLVYTPTMFVLRTVLKDSRRTMWFSTVGALLAPIPTAIIVFAWGGNSHGLISEEAIPFHVMFAVFGVIFGIGFALRPADRPEPLSK